VKHGFHYHLLASLAVFIIISIFLVIFKVGNIQIFYVFLGLALGSFVLDIDHFIFWYFIKPNLEESRLVKLSINHHDFKSVYNVLKTSHQYHHNLVFHHYFFQVILALFSFFIFTLTNNPFVCSLVIALNLHLLVDEIIDYFYNPKILQKWLFAREETQLPVKFLNRYILVFITLFFVFIIFLVHSQL
jgi:hypothetical protein